MPETFRAVALVRRDEREGATAFELAVLPHDERRVRRRLVPLLHGDGVLVDFPEPVTLYVTYRTVGVASDGSAVFRDDVYGRDKRVVAAMAKPRS